MSPDDVPPPPAPAGPPLAAVAFCPHPPMLLPAVAGGAAGETTRLRLDCAAALQTVLTLGPDVVLVVGDGPPGVRYGPGDAGDLAGYGLPRRVPFSGRVRPGGRRLPLAHTVGAWLLDEAGHDGIRLGVAPGDLATVLTELPGPVAVLAMGDGSARRTEKAPGHLDPAAGPFDAAVAVALATGDAAALAGLDEAEGARLLAAGVPTWRAVGAAVDGCELTARLRHDDAPHGVGWLVADWVVARTPDRLPGWLTR